MGERMFMVPQSVLENLVTPDCQHDALEAEDAAKAILAGTVVHKRPVNLDDLTEHQIDEVVRRREVKREALSESVNEGSGQALSVSVRGPIDGVPTQADGSYRLCLGVNRQLNVRGDTEELELVLGTFNTDAIATPHRCYKIAPDKLEAFMDKLVGQPLGEIGQGQFTEFNDPNALLNRLEKTDPADAWATLKSYRIEELEGSALRVYGTVTLTNRGRVLLADTGQALCSVRSIGNASPPGKVPNLFNVQALTAFDLVHK